MNTKAIFAALLIAFSGASLAGNMKGVYTDSTSVNGDKTIDWEIPLDGNQDADLPFRVTDKTTIKNDLFSSQLSCMLKPAGKLGDKNLVSGTCGVTKVTVAVDNKAWNEWAAAPLSAAGELCKGWVGKYAGIEGVKFNFSCNEGRVNSVPAILKQDIVSISPQPMFDFAAWHALEKNRESNSWDSCTLKADKLVCDGKNGVYSLNVVGVEHDKVLKPESGATYRAKAAPGRLESLLRTDVGSQNLTFFRRITTTPAAR